MELRGTGSVNAIHIYVFIANWSTCIDSTRLDFQSASLFIRYLRFVVVASSLFSEHEYVHTTKLHQIKIIYYAMQYFCFCASHNFHFFTVICMIISFINMTMSISTSISIEFVFSYECHNSNEKKNTNACKRAIELYQKQRLNWLDLVFSWIYWTKDSLKH